MSQSLLFRASIHIYRGRDRFQTEPHGNQLPHLLPLPQSPHLQRPSTRLALTKLGTLQLPELLRHIQRIAEPALAVEEVVLRGEIHELREVLAARSGGHAYAARGGLADVRHVGGVALVVVSDVLGAAHGLDEGGDNVLRGFFPEGETLDVGHA